MKTFNGEVIHRIKSNAEFYDCTISKDLVIEENVSTVYFTDCQFEPDVEVDCAMCVFERCVFQGTVHLNFSEENTSFILVKSCTPDRINLHVWNIKHYIPHWLKALNINHLTIEKSDINDAFIFDLLTVFKDIKGLSLAKPPCGIDKMREIARGLENIQSLTLNALKQVSLLGWVAQLPQVKKLYLHGAQLGSDQLNICYFPEVFFKHTSIECLEIHNTNIKQLPKECRFKKLKHLYLSGNSLCEIPNSWLTDSIRSLGVQDRQLTKIPPNVFTLKKLHHLVLGGFEPEQSLAGLQDLKKLLSLRLASMNLRSVPSEIMKLEKLTRLELPFNYIESIGISVTPLESLKSLCFRGNCLEDIGIITRIKNLSHFIGMLNNIKSIPDSVIKLAESNRLIADFRENALNKNEKRRARQAGFIV